jgi:molecular chaperone GrpE
MADIEDEDLPESAPQMDADDEIDPGSTLAKLMAENAQLKDQAMRALAEVENMRRRAEKEANDARAYAIQKFARDLLDPSDNLHKAVEHAPKDLADPALKNFVMGVEMSEKALQTAFERNGLKRVEPTRGEKFDPHKHQAMMEQAAEDVEPGAVVMVMQSGYELFGRVVRPAMVVVTPKASAQAAPGGQGDGGYGRSDGPQAGAAFDAKA